MKFFLSRLKTALTNQNFLCQELLRRVRNRLKKSFLTDLKGLFCTSDNLSQLHLQHSLFQLAGLFLPQSPSRQTLTASRTQEHEIDPHLTAHDSLCLNLSLDELSCADELVMHVCPNLKVPLPKLVQIVEKFEKVNASAKTEHEYISLIAMRLKSIRARYWKDAEAKNPLTSSSALG